MARYALRNQDKIADKLGKARLDMLLVEKARAFDPFGHAGFDPSGKIRMTP